MKITIDFVKLSDELNLVEKSEELPCGMQAVWGLLERASGKTIIDDRTSAVRKKLKIDINIVREKAYYYTRLKKKQREYLIELLLSYRIGG